MRRRFAGLAAAIVSRSSRRSIRREAISAWSWSDSCRDLHCGRATAGSDTASGRVGTGWPGWGGGHSGVGSMRLASSSSSSTAAAAVAAAAQGAAVAADDAVGRGGGKRVGGRKKGAAAGPAKRARVAGGAQRQQRQQQEEEQALPPPGEASGWFDGGARGNPGPAGCGALLRISLGHVLDRQMRLQQHGPGRERIGKALCRLATAGELRPVFVLHAHEFHSLHATNNEAEYAGLRLLMDTAQWMGGMRSLKVRGDSKLVIMQMLGKWKINKPHLRDWVAQLKQKRASSGIGHLSMVHVPRGQNSVADALSNRAMDQRTTGLTCSVVMSDPHDTDRGSLLPGASTPFPTLRVTLVRRGGDVQATTVFSGDGQQLQPTAVPADASVATILDGWVSDVLQHMRSVVCEDNEDDFGDDHDAEQQEQEQDGDNDEEELVELEDDDEQEQRAEEREQGESQSRVDVDAIASTAARAAGAAIAALQEQGHLSNGGETGAVTDAMFARAEEAHREAVDAARAATEAAHTAMAAADKAMKASDALAQLLESAVASHDDDDNR